MGSEVSERYGKSGKAAGPGEFIATPLLGSQLCPNNGQPTPCFFLPSYPCGTHRLPPNIDQGLYHTIGVVGGQTEGLGRTRHRKPVGNDGAQLYLLLFNQR